MQSSWHEVLAAARLLVAELAPTDTIHIVTYGTRGEEVLPPSPVGDGSAALRALGSIRVGGGTNIEAGLDIAYGAASRARLEGNDHAMVILISDGVPTEGAFDAGALASLAARARIEHGCTTTAVGLGNQFDADVLRAIAREGRGGYHVARSADRVAPPLVAELRAQARIAARDVRVDVALAPGVELLGTQDVGVGIERTASGVRLTLPQLRAEEERRFALRVRVPGSDVTSKVAQVAVAYRPATDGRIRRASRDVRASFGAEARLSGGISGIAALDADLAVALDAAGRAIQEGRRDDAVAALRAHVRVARGWSEHHEVPAVRHRTDAVARLAVALDALVDTSSHTERREVAHALGALAVRFGI